MSPSTSTKVCQCHRWERRLEVHGGVECVVRVCPCCGHKELCWSRRGLPAETAAAFRAKEGRRIGRAFVDRGKGTA